jgi:hypothetical protein
MGYIDFDRLEQIDERAYQARRPFPWINPENLLFDSGYERLRDTLPELSLFSSSFGVARKNQQQSHDRYLLEYQEGLPLSEPWRECLAELGGERYRANLCRLLGLRSVALNFHWHYTPNGALVSPHTDSVRKAGSHIFYFNTEEDWDPAWGGHTVILDDGGRLPSRSSPQFEDFGEEIPAETAGNRSLIFSRTDHAWHGMRPIRCPQDKYRKVFIVVINKNRPQDKIRRLFNRKQFHYY